MIPFFSLKMLLAIIVNDDVIPPIVISFVPGETMLHDSVTTWKEQDGIKAS